jgi:AcrR family transcriptional regulator
MEGLSKQQLRTQETQARLLNAAEEVFVREGFESAQLDEIAATAGRSKGAVYTHFKSKEDLFLALFEHRTRTFISRLTDRLENCTNQEQSLEAFREFYVDLAHDKTWPILTLEFKLFALRHPESKERLRNALDMAKGPNDDMAFERMFGILSRRQRADIDLSLVALGPLLSAVILESHFEPQILPEKGIKRLLGRIFDALFAVCR